MGDQRQVSAPGTALAPASLRAELADRLGSAIAAVWPVLPDRAHSLPPGLGQHQAVEGGRGRVRTCDRSLVRRELYR
jgi:hypothetical protein